uniref:Btz domain-containing protein n=1 Tax=Bursaphelenchus xylophilus TaxID=6326 RepID=A0A1I7SN62_BURXY
MPLFSAEQWKMNVPEFGDGAATSRRRRFGPGHGRRRPNPRPGFQHDDRFAANGDAEKVEGAESGENPDSRPPRRFNNRRRGPRAPREPKEGEEGVAEGEARLPGQRRGPPRHHEEGHEQGHHYHGGHGQQRPHRGGPKRDIFERVAKVDENGEAVPFRGPRPRRGPPRPITARKPFEVGGFHTNLL